MYAKGSKKIPETKMLINKNPGIGFMNAFLHEGRQSLVKNRIQTPQKFKSAKVTKWERNGY